MRALRKKDRPIGLKFIRGKDHSRRKLNEELKGKNYINFLSIRLNWPVVNVEIKPRIYVIFAIEFDGKCKFVRKDRNITVIIKIYRMFIAATLD